MCGKMADALKIWLWFLSVLNGMQCLFFDLISSRYPIPRIFFWLPVLRLAGIYLILFKRKKCGLYIQCITYIIAADLYSLLLNRSFLPELLQSAPVLLITWLFMRKTRKSFE
jgi:hypothetical protein